MKRVVDKGEEGALVIKRINLERAFWGMVSWASCVSHRRISLVLCFRFILVDISRGRLRLNWGGRRCLIVDTSGRSSRRDSGAIQE